MACSTNKLAVLKASNTLRECFSNLTVLIVQDSGGISVYILITDRIFPSGITNS